MIWYILLSILLVTMLWILFGPVIVFLNTDHSRYSITLPGIFKAALVPDEKIFHIRARVFFIPFKVNPFKRKKKAVKKEGTVPGKKKTRKRTGSIRMLKGALGAFRIRKLVLDIDTDDFTLNAWLVPAFSGVNNENIQMRVNFEGNAFLHLDLRTRISSLLWLLFKNR